MTFLLPSCKLPSLPLHLPPIPAQTDPPLSSRPCVLQLLPLTWLRPRHSWAVGLGSAASQGTQQLPHPWLLLSRLDRHCRWSFYGITRAQVSGQWLCLLLAESGVAAETENLDLQATPKL